ncbi:MAG TPA: exodeoxyribonuclease VII large subunit [Caulobacterales bacterium]|nr:exodeoxyribonuclease VII large subunit [Caulobacterales bacterium]
MPDSAAPDPQTNLPEISVSELANAIKRTVEREFDRVRVRGELGRVLIAKSGHLYVDLKDENATISTVMWKTNVAQLKFKPEEGLEVVVEGKLSTYPGRSQYQLIAERMAPAGVGALLAQLEKLKAKLQAEGLFAPERKKPIPFLPRTIGIITSPTGAVIRDILHRLEDRFPRRVLLWPVLVQGEYAAEQVAKAIAGFNKLQGDLRPDVLIVARGGGSIEDLWAFNEEIVARAAAASVIPLISAVGHETDTTLIDFVSDRRAPTPTAAAEMAVPVRAELVERVGTLGARLGGGVARGLERRRVDLRAAGARLPRPDMLLGLAQQRFDRAAEKLGRALMANERAAEGKFARVASRLRPEALTQDVARRRQRVSEVGQRLAEGLRRRVAEKSRALEAQGRLLETLSHQSVLARGFALAMRADGTLVRAAAGLAEGDALRLRFADGETPVTVGEGGAKRKKGDPPKQGSLF